MNPVKGVLSEELENSERLLKRYRQAIEAFPKGSLVPKKIKGGMFYYLAYRKGEKVHFEYKGKLSAGEISDYKQVANQKKKYRSLLADLKKQIIFLKRALHERKKRSRADAALSRKKPRKTGFRRSKSCARSFREGTEQKREPSLRNCRQAGARLFSPD
jgi:hypothetical protein